MNTQERNREALIRHIADLDAVIRRRNEQIENQAHNARETQRALEEIARERDEARRGARAAFARCRELEKARQEVVDELYSLRVTAPRPLTPDVITDEMVERGRDYMSINTGQTHTHKAIRGVLTAALTEPPARPKGAERFDLVVDAAIRGHSDITSPVVVRAISDAIAAHLTDPTRKDVP